MPLFQRVWSVRGIYHLVRRRGGNGRFPVPASASPSGDGTSELDSTLTDIGVVATVDAQADGKRFIVFTKPKGKETQITLVTNQITKSKK